MKDFNQEEIAYIEEFSKITASIFKHLGWTYGEEVIPDQQTIKENIFELLAPLGYPITGEESGRIRAEVTSRNGKTDSYGRRFSLAIIPISGYLQINNPKEIRGAP